MGSDSIDREVNEAEGTYTLREQRGAYASHFGADNDVLTLDNAIPWMKTNLGTSI
jgi:hypothetical protein